MIVEEAYIDMLCHHRKAHSCEEDTIYRLVSFRVREYKIFMLRLT